jgi:acetyl-CoA carboxylase biotin carboxylase subunit
MTVANMFKKILVCGRGEIALRIVRACKELGIETVAVYSTADKNSMHIYLADESVCIGPAQSSKSYMNIPSIISAAELTNVDAIHPCIGFLSENANFATCVEAHLMSFIGPSPEHVQIMGNKIEARNMAAEIGFQVVPGSGRLVNNEDIIAAAQAIAYPIIIKAAAGGGGRGIRVVYKEKDLLNSISLVKSEAKTSFGSDEIYIEKYLANPRHIEFQVICDQHGNAVHLGERDCSIQRRHQKLFEESPSPVITEEIRAHMGEKVCEAMRKLKYRGVGTIEFLFENGEFYFMEMNTRLQVEHTITEMVTGIDIVKEQIRVAAGFPLSFTQNDVKIKGHAIECRINAENADLMPCAGKITDYLAPGGMGVRVDSNAYSGYTISPHYDSLIAKLICHSETRNQCINKTKNALNEFVIEGISTNLNLHKKLVNNNDVLNGNYDVKWLETLLEEDK